jgi:NADH:ubiquinone oxidoreductase subunit 6 (subunit J)
MTSFPFSDYLIAVIFGVAALTTVTGALVAVMSTRLIRGVSGLMLCCIGLAGLFYFLHSPFLALMEILIYVGAVCITIIFGVMLSEPDESPASNGRSSGVLLTGGAAFIATMVFVALARLSLRAPWPAPPAERLNDGSVAAIGTHLLTTYSMAFELISLVLLVAILGALVIARGGRNQPAPPGGPGSATDAPPAPAASSASSPGSTSGSAKAELVAASH